MLPDTGFLWTTQLSTAHWAIRSFPLLANLSVCCQAMRMILMRDIRPDLRERLADVNDSYATESAEFERKQKALEHEHKRRLDALARERAALEQLLVVENERGGIAAPTLAQKLATLVPLGDFLVAKLQMYGPMEKNQLRTEAKLAGYFAHGNGRTFHITLMNITNGGRVTLLPDGRYAFPDHQPAIFDRSEEGAMRTLHS